MCQPRHLFGFIFVIFRNNFTEKIFIDFRQTRTRLVGLKGKHADHLTMTSAQLRKLTRPWWANVHLYNAKSCYKIGANIKSLSSNDKLDHLVIEAVFVFGELCLARWNLVCVFYVGKQTWKQDSGCWLSWQGSRFPYQRTRVRIEALANFIKQCKLLKRKKMHLTEHLQVQKFRIGI